MADDEIVAIVDENNEMVGTAARRTVRGRRLIHRATYVFVFNREGELYLQRRTPTKDMYPGYLDAAAGGVVLADESYQVSAEREAAEELGIRGIRLEHHFEFYYEDRKNRIWGAVFTCRYEGPFVHQPEEVEDGFFVAVRDVLEERYRPVTPDTLEALRRLVSHDSSIARSS